MVSRFALGPTMFMFAPMVSVPPAVTVYVPGVLALMLSELAKLMVGINAVVTGVIVVCEIALAAAIASRRLQPPFGVPPPETSLHSSPRPPSRRSV